MAFYRQNVAQIPPRNGTAPCRNAYPYSITTYGPQMLPQAMDNPGSTQPSDGFSAWPPNLAAVDGAVTVPGCDRAPNAAEEPPEDPRQGLPVTRPLERDATCVGS